MLERNGVILDVKFPLNVGQRYWNIHYLYVLNIFKYLNYNISFVDRGQAFIVTLNNKDFLIDYADSSDNINDLSPNPASLPILKFHCNEISKNVYPFPPVSFYDWDAMYRLQSTINYNPASNLYSYRTQAYGNARERRTNVYNIVKPLSNVLTGMIPQQEYFNEISKIKASIQVDGHHLGMVDRSFSQMAALGCPIITTYKPDLLPYGATWDKCYILCKDDYSNLIDIMSTVNHIQLGLAKERAKWTFNKYCTPEAIGKYLEEIVSYV